MEWAPARRVASEAPGCRRNGEADGHEEERTKGSRERLPEPRGGERRRHRIEAREPGAVKQPEKQGGDDRERRQPEKEPGGLEGGGRPGEERHGGA
jgi:hypothetical protein